MVVAEQLALSTQDIGDPSEDEAAVTEERKLGSKMSLALDLLQGGG